MMKKVLFLLLISATVFSACRVTWSPAKSPSMIANVLDVQNSTSNLYSTMIAATDKSYTTYAADYQSIDNKIDSIVVVNSSREHGANVYKQSLLLQKYFKKYEADHQAKGSLTTGELRVYKSYLQSFIKPVLVSELSLK